MMNVALEPMKDIQSLSDNRRINIKKVGVKTISYPITLRDKAQKRQHTVALANMYVNLPHNFKGTHMSRFVEILNEFHGEINVKNFHIILEKMKERLEAEASHLEVSFPFFLQRGEKGESGVQSVYQCSMHGSLEDSQMLELAIQVPISIPFAERVARRLPGSFGKWGRADIRVRLTQFHWIEDIILAVEEAVECERNGDQVREKKVFSVEHLAKTVAGVVAEVSAVCWYSVTITNFGEDCSTFATIESC